MKKRFFPALMATAFLASAGIPSAQATEVVAVMHL